MTTVQAFLDVAAVYCRSSQLRISQRRPTLRTEGHHTAIIRPFPRPLLDLLENAKFKRSLLVWMSSRKLAKNLPYKLVCKLLNFRSL